MHCRVFLSCPFPQVVQGERTQLRGPGRQHAGVGAATDGWTEIRAEGEGENRQYCLP